MSSHFFRLVPSWMPTAAARGSAVSIVALLAALCCGCGFGGGPPSLDEVVARGSLTKALDAWKQGQMPESLQQASPPIIVGDTQWSAGARLVEYEVLEPSSSDGSNLHVTVKLELEDGAGKRSTQPVEYIVGTSPKITVFSQEPEEDL